MSLDDPKVQNWRDRSFCGKRTTHPADMIHLRCSSILLLQIDKDIKVQSKGITIQQTDGSNKLQCSPILYSDGTKNS
jgi:hypothetical protein